MKLSRRIILALLCLLSLPIVADGQWQTGPSAGLVSYTTLTTTGAGTYSTVFTFQPIAGHSVSTELRCEGQDLTYPASVGYFRSSMGFYNSAGSAGNSWASTVESYTGALNMTPGYSLSGSTITLQVSTTDANAVHFVCSLFPISN